MIIDGVEYIRKEEAALENFQSSSLTEWAVGKHVIVRSHNEGINFGLVVAADETGVVLKGARRLWYHEPKDNAVSWYEGTAISGLNDNCKISAAVSLKAIIEDYSMTGVSEEAIKSIQEYMAHAQNS